MHHLHHAQFFFVHAAVVKNQFRDKPVEDEGAECPGGIAKFLFAWEAVGAGTTSGIAFSKSILRLYVQVAEKLLSTEDGGETIPVNISTSLQLYHKNMTMNTNLSTDSFQLVQTVNVTSESEGWMELDMTAFVSSVWSPVVKKAAPIIQVTLRMEVDCVQHTKVPIKFVNPAEVELDDTVFREQCEDQQPLLLVYLDDPSLKQIMKDEEKLAEEKKKFATENGNTQFGMRRRKKRFSLESDCQLKDFTLRFNEMSIQTRFYMPTMLNIGICMGNCTYVDILPLSRPPTFHARMMANAVYHEKHKLYKRPDSPMYLETHKDPCCAPSKYYSRYAITYQSGMFRLTLFKDIVAAECECK